MSLFRLALPRSSLVAAPRPLCLRAAARSASTASSEPIVLPRLQADLKTAMRAKNKPALNTIRSLQAEIINASKTTKPIESDFAFFMLLQKQMKAANTAIEEFRAAKREDLASKEQEQLEVLQKYYDDIPKLEESEIDATISEVVKSLEADGPKFGMIMSAVMQKLKGKTFDVEMVTSKINEVVGKK